MSEYKIIRRDLGEFDIYVLKKGTESIKRNASLYELLSYAKNNLGVKTIEVLGVERYIGGVSDES